MEFFKAVILGSFLMWVFLTALKEPQETLSREEGTFEREAVPVVASWYGPGFHGKCMADGRIYNKRDLTVAHKALPLGTILELTRNGRSVNVTVTDRGPYITGRSIDLSEKVAEVLQIKEAGVATINVRPIYIPDESVLYHHQNERCLS